MSAAAHRALRRALQEQVFDRVYYFFGDDDYLKEQSMRQVIDRAVDPATRDFNLENRRGADLDGETLSSLLATPPMMAERRLVIIRDVPALRRDARAALDAYLTRPAADTVVLLIAGAGAKPDRTLERSALAVEFPTLTGDRVPKWIAHYVTTELKATISPSAVELLQSASGNDLPQLAAELDKLASYADGREIDDAAVAAVVGVRRGETLGDLLDRVAMRDTAGALDLVDHVLAQPKTTAVTVVMALATQMMAIAWACAARSRGSPPALIERDLYSLLRESGALTGRAWGEAVRCWMRALGRWDAEMLERALDALLAADWALKESRLSSDEQLLSSLILTICTDRHAVAA